jgi:hypothetical protein
VDVPLEIQADAIRWEAGVAEAIGAVEVHLGDDTLVGARATWDGVVLRVEQGEYRRADGVFAFDSAEVRPAAGTASVVTTRIATGGAEIRADRLELAEGKWQAVGATVLPCLCTDGAPPAITLSAARITVIPDRVVILHGGVFRVFGAPILPVPWARLPLDPHRFRVLLPELGWGEDGPSARLAGRGGVGDYFLEGGPAWSLDRGPRAELALTGPPGIARGAIGYDLEAAAVRGVVASRGGIDTPVARVAWDTSWVSDADYLADYAVDYVTRGVSFRESRGVVAVGPGALDAWLPDDGSSGALVRGRLDRRFGDGPTGATPRLVVALEGDVDGGALVPVAEVGVGGRAAAELPWLSLEGRADLAARGGWSDGLAVDGPNAGAVRASTGWGWDDGLAAAPLARGGSWRGLGGVAAGSASIPVWSSVRGGPAVQWWPGVRGEVRTGANVDGADAAARVGPALRASTAWAAGGMDVDVAVMQDGSGWRPTGALDVHLERVQLRVQADPDVQLGNVRWTPGVVEFGAGTARAGALWLTWGDASLALGRLRTGGGVAWDLTGAAFSGADARIGYDDGCFAATLSAHFGPDRPLPELGVAATMRR